MSTLFSYVKNGRPYLFTNKKNSKPYLVTSTQDNTMNLIGPNRPIKLIYKHRKPIKELVYKNLLANSTEKFPKQVIDSINCFEGNLSQSGNEPGSHDIDGLHISKVHLYTLTQSLLKDNLGLVIIKNDELIVDIYDPPAKSVSIFGGTLEDFF